MSASDSEANDQPEDTNRKKVTDLARQSYENLKDKTWFSVVDPDDPVFRD